jgi:hypothetical protein
MFTHPHPTEQMRHETARVLAKAARLVRNPKVAYERLVWGLRGRTKVVPFNPVPSRPVPRRNAA